MTGPVSPASMLSWIKGTSSTTSTNPPMQQVQMVASSSLRLESALSLLVGVDGRTAPEMGAGAETEKEAVNGSQSGAGSENEVLISDRQHVIDEEEADDLDFNFALVKRPPAY